MAGSASAWPVNSKSEIVLAAGDGNTIVTGFMSQGQIPATADGRIKLAGVAPSRTSDNDYNIGAYYFPGWSTPGGGPNPTNPWAIIPTNRLPLIGMFDETKQSVCDYNLEMARDYGLKFFAYDWYADIVNNTYVPFLDHAINNHKKSTVYSKPKYCVNFIVQTNAAKFSLTTWPLLYNFWINNYFNDPNYLTINNKPVVMIFDVSTFSTRMGGTSQVTQALDSARNAAIAAGFAGIHFVGLQADSSNFWMSACLTHGWDGMSSYTIFSKYLNGGDTSANSKTGFDRLDDAIFSADEVISSSTYHSWWGNTGYTNPPTLVDTGSAWVAPAAPSSNGWGGKNFPSFIIPIASGYDARPWTYSSTLQGIPTADQFEAHLIKARQVIDTNRAKTKGFGIITAWNEFGEGSFIMPTVTSGYEKLQAIKRVFG